MKRTRRLGGHTLVSTTVFLVLATLLSLTTFTQMASSLRIAKTFAVRQDHAASNTKALAWGLALLETGTPPQSPYACRVAPNPDAGPTFVVTFQETSNLHYSVSVRPAGPDDESLPLNPTDFSP